MESAPSPLSGGGAAFIMQPIGGVSHARNKCSLGTVPRILELQYMNFVAVERVRRSHFGSRTILQ